MNIGTLVLHNETGQYGIVLKFCQRAFGKSRWGIAWSDGSVNFEWENRLEIIREGKHPFASY
jgi:hypothetical protein